MGRMLCYLSGAGISETHNSGMEVGVGVPPGEYTRFCMQVCVSVPMCTCLYVPACEHAPLRVCVYVCTCHGHKYSCVRTSGVCVFAHQFLVPGSSKEAGSW